uniref:Protein serine/threonine phosphatase 2C C-terminal domain-containing protein n=1 Tax=Eptatretus burgeri TaxID=7764 RepID=A0A8C4NFD7_EPTBU
MSAILICFQNSPKICPELVQQEKELDKLLETKVEELLKRSGEEAIPDIVSLMRSLSMEDIPNLPPGGGLASNNCIYHADHRYRWRSLVTRASTDPVWKFVLLSG